MEESQGNGAFEFSWEDSGDYLENGQVECQDALFGIGTLTAETPYWVAELQGPDSDDTYANTGDFDTIRDSSEMDIGTISDPDSVPHIWDDIAFRRGISIDSEHLSRSPEQHSPATSSYWDNRSSSQEAVPACICPQQLDALSSSGSSQAMSSVSQMRSPQSAVPPDSDDLISPSMPTRVGKANEPLRKPARQLRLETKPEICKKCFKGYQYRRDLERHYVIHHKREAKDMKLNMSRKVCSRCSKTFSRADHLKRHLDRPTACKAKSRYTRSNC